MVSPSNAEGPGDNSFLNPQAQHIHRLQDMAQTDACQNIFQVNAEILDEQMDRNREKMANKINKLRRDISKSSAQTDRLANSMHLTCLIALALLGTTFYHLYCR